MKLTDFLERRALSHAEFGRRVGVTAEAVRLWTVGKRIPSHRYMRAISMETEAAVTANDFHSEEAAA